MGDTLLHVDIAVAPLKRRLHVLYFHTVQTWRWRQGLNSRLHTCTVEASAFPAATRSGHVRVLKDIVRGWNCEVTIPEQRLQQDFGEFESDCSD